MTDKGNPQRHTLFHEKKKYVYHIVWHAGTGYWPDWGAKREVIHHVDENPLNNEFGNLRLMTNSEHRILHRTGAKDSKETRAKMRANKIEHWKDPEYRNKLMGENSSGWKGDDAKPQSKYKREWRAQRRQNNNAS